MICEGNSDNCLGLATTTRDTSWGWLKPVHFCASCAAEYDNREPGDPDGEAFRGGEATAFQRDEQARIQRELK